MRKNYQKPEVNIVLLKTGYLLGTNSVQVNNVGGNGGLHGAGEGGRITGGSGTARSRSGNQWDDEDEY